MAVQVGFAIGALVLALTGAADVVPARRLIAIGALVAAAANAAFGLLAVDLATAIPLRALSGAGIAAVYPVAMKVLAGWFGRERGLAVGVLIGAITLGSAIPYALRAGGAIVDLDWRLVVVAGSVPCVLAAAIAWAARPRWPAGRPRGAVQPAPGSYGAGGAIGAARQPRLPRPHVGALRDVDLGPGLPRGQPRR